MMLTTAEKQLMAIMNATDSRSLSPRARRRGAVGLRQNVHFLQEIITPVGQTKSSSSNPISSESTLRLRESVSDKRYGGRWANKSDVDSVSNDLKRNQLSQEEDSDEDIETYSDAVSPTNYQQDHSETRQTADTLGGKKKGGAGDSKAPAKKLDPRLEILIGKLNTMGAKVNSFTCVPSLTY